MNTDILRQRRNLIGMSIALSIYQLAGGDLKTSSVLFGSIKLQNPDVVIYLAWFSLIYFLWRYWIHTKKFRGALKKSRNDNFYYQSEERSYLFDLHNSLCLDKSYKNLLNSKLENNEFISKLLNSQAVTPIIVRKLFKRFIDGSYLYNFNNPQSGNTPPTIHIFQIDIPYFEILKFELKAQIKAIFIEKSFSDYCLPYYITAIPFITYYYKNIFKQEQLYFFYNLIFT